MVTENNREQSTVLLGDLYSVRIKLVQSEVRDPERVRETRGLSENQAIGGDLQDRRR
jgi:hypothetical protein